MLKTKTAAHRLKGFTLIELMVVVLIVAILTAVAYPSYIQHVQSTARTEAQGELMNAAATLEKLYATNLSYAAATISVPPSSSGTIIGWAPFDQSSANARYLLTFASGSPTASTWTIIATATALQTSGGEVMEINNQGQHCIKQSTAAVSSCTFGTDSSW